MTARETHLYRHINFSKTDIESGRRVPPGRSRPPERNNVEYGRELSEKVEIISKEFANLNKEKPPEFNPALIFKLKFDQEVSEDEWRRSNLTVLQEGLNKVIILFSPDQLEEFSKRIGIYSAETHEDGQPSYKWIAALTQEISLYSRDDRVGKKLSRVEINIEDIYVVDVELWDYGTARDNAARMNELRIFINKSKGSILDTYSGNGLNIARIKVLGGVLEELLKVDTVQLIDIPPQPVMTIGNIIGTPLDNFPSPINSPPDGSPGICIIDSGVGRGHPMLAPAIGETVSFPRSLGEGLDVFGHGTRVAGIALYGDVKACIDTLNFEPNFFVFGAQVTNANGSFDDERLIVNQMQDAIYYFYHTHGCRVFNLSLADPELIYIGGKVSTWANVLDALIRELDIVITISAGNLAIASVTGSEAVELLRRYPQYLLDESSRILEPATAVNAITVGSLASSDGSRMSVFYPNDPAYRCLAGIDDPSPFTRCGPGVNGSIKPDVCEYGGNVTIDLRGTPRILAHDTEVGIISTYHKHTDRLFDADVGTSFAAPKVANLAATILQNYPGASSDLIRALIANSAEIPTKSANLDIDLDALLNVYGYGLPDREKAIYSSDNRTTLFAEDSIITNRLHLYEIPVPPEFKETKGRRQITITLAYSPPVRSTRLDYLGVKMEFRLIRGMTTAQIIDKYGIRTNTGVVIDNSETSESFEDKNLCKLNPGLQRRNRGTLQKGVFDISQNTSMTNYSDSWHILVACKPGWYSQLSQEPQKYALVTTLEHLESPIQLYNIIENRIMQKTRVRIQR